MKIVHINTYGNYGGAGIACKRISEAINRIPGQSSLILDKDSFEDNRHFFRSKPFPTWQTRINFALDLAYNKLNGVQKKYEFTYSPSQNGRDIENWELIRNADILHLHWFNQGFLSFQSLKQLARLNKPIVWTLHDMWAMTGGCHHSGTCSNYQQTCGNCFMMKNGSPGDISALQYTEKQKIYHLLNLHFVCPSTWLKGKALSSSLLKALPISVIPNPIDTDLFKPGNRSLLRKKFNWEEKDFIIIMNAFKITNENKGFKYLIQALEILKGTHPEISEKIRLVLIGEVSPKDWSSLPFRIEAMGYMKDPKQIIELNQAADLYTTPSLEENLPNTIMEALACGLPTIAFYTGGIPDLIDHKVTGYLAEKKSSADFSKGLVWAYWHTHGSNEFSDDIRIYCREKVLRDYTYSKIGMDYLRIYQKFIPGA